MFHPINLPLPCVFHPVHVVTSCLSFQPLHPIHLPLPFVSCRSFRYLLPFASTLLSCSSCSSFRFNLSISLPPSFRCNLSLPFVTPFLSFQLFYMRFIYLLLSFHVVHFVTSFLSLQLFFPVRLALPFVSTRPFHCLRPFVATFPFHSLLPSFRFNSFSSRSLLLPFRFNYRASDPYTSFLSF